MHFSLFFSERPSVHQMIQGPSISTAFYLARHSFSFPLSFMKASFHCFGRLTRPQNPCPLFITFILEYITRNRICSFSDHFSSFHPLFYFLLYIKSTINLNNFSCLPASFIIMESFFPLYFFFFFLFGVLTRITYCWEWAPFYFRLIKSLFFHCVSSEVNTIF